MIFESIFAKLVNSILYLLVKLKMVVVNQVIISNLNMNFVMKITVLMDPLDMEVM